LREYDERDLYLYETSSEESSEESSSSISSIEEMAPQIEYIVQKKTAIEGCEI